MNWDYLQPVKIHFGKGRVKEIKEIARELAAKEAFWWQDRFSLKAVLPKSS